MSDSRKITLANKYRPLVFKDVLDQDAIVTVLSNILKDKNYSSPFMFTGHYGGGKTTLARIFARAILCENLTENYEPCNKCSSCVDFLNDSNLAYNEIDAASNSGVDQMRKLRDEANFTVLGSSERKVVVIDECHSITAQGNEALLKQLEDNTGKQVYIFCTTAPEKMLETVRSRCFEFNLNKISITSISDRLEEICKIEKIQFEKEALDIIADQSAPHVRDALKSLDFLRNFGKVTQKVVIEHYKLSTKTEYLKIILNLKDDVLESLKLAKSVSLSNDIPTIYEGMIDAILSCKKFMFGMNVFRTQDQMDLAKKIITNYTINLDNLLEELLKRNRYVDILLLESDIILLHTKLKTNFVNISPENIQLVEYRVQAPTSIQPVNELAKQTKVQTAPVVETAEVVEAPVAEEKPPVVESKPSEPEATEPLEQTTKILQRYKAYPEELAMLMDKGKKSKSSSIKNSQTVELKQRVKDYKRNVDKDEIKNFLETRRIIT